MTREQRLTELRDELFNAENRVDGCYYSGDEKFSDLTEINQRYEKLISDMNKLIELINKEIN